MDVVAYRLFGEVEVSCNFLVGEALKDQGISCCSLEVNPAVARTVKFGIC